MTLDRRILAVSLCFVACACLQEENPEPREVIPLDTVPSETEPSAAEGSATTEPESETIERIQDDYPQYAHHFEGIREGALGDESKGRADFEAASEHYLNALKASSGAVAKHLMPPFIESVTSSFKEVVTTEALRAVLVEKLTRIERQKLLTEFEASRKENLEAYVRREFPSKIAGAQPAHGEKTKSEETKSETVASGAVLPPPSADSLRQDPLLNKTFERYCSIPQASRGAWDAWTAALPPLELKYWQALAVGCSAKGKSIELLRGFLDSSRDDAAAAALALNAGRKIVEFYRSEGNRADLPELYLQMMNLWKLKAFSAAELGMAPMDFETTRINDALWTARYRSLTGDYENAKILADLALSQVANVYSTMTVTNPKDNEELAIFRAEAYHVLAFRIALEKRQIESAIALTKQALVTPYLNKEWLDTLNWNLGMYHFLGNDFQKAIATWQGLQQFKKDGKPGDRELYWLAVCHVQLGEKAQARSLLAQLAESEPLSFYNIVGAELLWPRLGKRVGNFFPNKSQLAKRFTDLNAIDLASLRAHASVGPLLIRSELLINHGLMDWARLSYKDLEAELREAFTPAGNPGAYVYLSRIAHASGLYDKSLAYNDTLNKSMRNYWYRWPEQVLLAFPRPFADLFQRRSMETGVDSEVLFSVARQESQFNPNAASPAGAYGLMQIIPETARRINQDLGLPADQPSKEQMLQPDYNLQVGANYLKTLKKHYEGFDPAIYAAYNAGEAAVDSWLKRRFHPDPLIWTELIPYGETRNYVKRVWRNHSIYRKLSFNESFAFHMPENMKKVQK